MAGTAALHHLADLAELQPDVLRYGAAHMVHDTRHVVSLQRAAMTLTAVDLPVSGVAPLIGGRSDLVAVGAGLGGRYGSDE
jgi:hypothetical protein